MQVRICANLSFKPRISLTMYQEEIWLTVSFDVLNSVVVSKEKCPIIMMLQGVTLSLKHYVSM